MRIKELKRGSSPITRVCYSPDGKYIGIGDKDESLVIVETETLYVKEIKLGLHGVVCFDLGSNTLTCGGKYPFIHSIDTKTWDWLDSEGYGGWIYSIAISPDERYIAVHESKNGLIVTDVEAYEDLFSDNYVFNNRIAFSPDSNFIAYVKCFNGCDNVVIKDLKNTCHVIEIDTYMFGCISLAFSPCGKYLVGGFDVGPFVVWDVKNEGAVKFSSERLFGVTSIAFIQDKNYLVVAMGEGVIGIWDIITWEYIGEIKTGSSKITSISNVSGSDLAVGYYDGTAITMKI